MQAPVVFRPPEEPVADERTLAVLDFPAVLQQLADRCASSLGRERALALRPSARPRQVRADLEETDEARALCDRAARPPLEGLYDVGPLVARAARDAVLSARELWTVGETAACICRLRAFFAACADRAPRLADWATLLHDLSEVASEVVRCLLPDGEVLDRASPALAAARQQVRRLEAALRERLDELLRSPALAGVLQEPLVTLRRDRFVLPVRADQRAALPGLVHDQSASGATVFVEPLALVELGNELRAAQAAVAEEVARVLRRLSALCGARQEEFRQSLEAAAHLDFAVAKGRLSADWGALAPRLLDQPVLELRAARHPLIARPVPVDLRLGLDFDALVLTGPNTGGKTVSLKIAGLFACMLQSGLHLPVGAGSAMGVFPRICGDAGDDQGVAQSLSTFSSHMRAVVAAVEAVRPGALVLLDELGAGTDPGEGAALAMALLEHLLAVGARAIVTTHYSELKAFAYRTPRVANAAMSFDAQTLQPTFRLEIGVPGGSHAFTIARRLGLPARIVDRAAELQRPEARTVETMIAGMASEERRRRQAAEQAEAERVTAAQLRARLEREAAEQEAARAAVLAEAREQARALLLRARREADAVLREMRRLADEQAARLRAPAGGTAPSGAEAAQGAVRAAEAQRQRLAAVMDAVGAQGAEPPAWASASQRQRPLRVGDPVRVRSLGRDGVLLALPGEGQALVQAGALRLHVPAEDLEAAAPGAAAGVEGRGRRGADAGVVAAGAAVLPRWAPDFRAECDLRGLRAADALARVDKLLDEAVLAGAPEVRLIHGRGTGALREAIGEFLRGHPQVAGFRLGGAGEGGDGATVVAVRA